MIIIITSGNLFSVSGFERYQLKTDCDQAGEHFVFEQIRKDAFAAQQQGRSRGKRKRKQTKRCEINIS